MESSSYTRRTHSLRRVNQSAERRSALAVSATLLVDSARPRCARARAPRLNFDNNITHCQHISGGASHRSREVHAVDSAICICWRCNWRAPSNYSQGWDHMECLFAIKLALNSCAVRSLFYTCWQWVASSNAIYLTIYSAHALVRSWKSWWVDIYWSKCVSLTTRYTLAKMLYDHVQVERDGIFMPSAIMQ
jgi:hypothetical protein